MSPLKKRATNVLKRLGVYERLKASWVYHIYWALADSEVLRARRKEIGFYRRVLTGFRGEDLVFDIGANQGYKTEIFLALGAKVVAVDPDEVNERILAERFVRYRVRPRPVVILRRAVSDGAGVETMWLDAPGSAKNTLSVKWVAALREDETRFGHRLAFASSKVVKTTTIDDLFRQYGVPFFIKIDVEGHELAVLRGMSSPVSYLSFEVNMPEFTAEGLECIDQLNHISSLGQFNYATDCQGDLALREWRGYREFRRTFRDVTERCVEIFWRT